MTLMLTHLIILIAAYFHIISEQIAIALVFATNLNSILKEAISMENKSQSNHYKNHPNLLI